MFDEYVSLGFNCEVAFQMRRRLGEAPAGFFNWRVADVAAICRLIQRRFADLMRDDMVMPGANVEMRQDMLYGYEFHRTDDLPAERAKMAALGQRFLDQQGRRLYLMKPYDRDLTPATLALLADHLRQIDPDHAVVLLLRDGQPTPVLPHGFAVERLRFHTPVHQADQGDAEGYDRVFDRYGLHSAASYAPLKNRSALAPTMVAPPALASTRAEPVATA